MPVDLSKLLDEALRLPLEARARLVGELLRSLDEHDSDELDHAAHAAAWDAEIAERLRAVEQGEVQPVPWREARQRLTREEP